MDPKLGALLQALMSGGGQPQGMMPPEQEGPAEDPQQSQLLQLLMQLLQGQGGASGPQGMMGGGQGGMMKMMGG